MNDLTNHGITEPYRMFTSRAEHRLLLSQNNAEQRLLLKAHKLGLISDKRKEQYLLKEEKYKVFFNTNLKKQKLTHLLTTTTTQTNLTKAKAFISFFQDQTLIPTSFINQAKKKKVFMKDRL